MLLSLADINQYVRITLFFLSVLSMLYFFSKMARYPERTYGLLMVFILMAPLFVASGLKLASLFMNDQTFFFYTVRIMNFFVSIWIVCLAFYHYSLLRSFKKKFKRFPFRRYITAATLFGITLSISSRYIFNAETNNDYMAIRIFDGVVLSFICFRTYRFKDEIKFGPYSVVRESASRLAIFSFIQALFCFAYLSRDALANGFNCSSQPTDESQDLVCNGLDLANSLLYQGWMWYAILFNWRVIDLKSQNDSSASSSMISANSVEQSKSHFSMDSNC